jgi:integrase
MHRSEINDNWWTIPPERSLKNDEEQRVFLSPLALTLIGAKRGYICPGEPDMPISENSVAHHVRRKVSNTGKISYYGLPRWTPHDLRRTFGTGVIRLGATREIMEAILGHTIPGVAGVYNRHKYDPEKKKWSLKWSTWLEKILNITTTGTEKKSAVNKSKAEVARKRQRKSPKGSGLARTASPKKQ